MNSFCDCLYNIITCYIKLEASDLASVSAGHHDKKSVLCIGCISPEFSYFIHLIVYFWMQPAKTIQNCLFFGTFDFKLQAHNLAWRCRFSNGVGNAV